MKLALKEFEKDGDVDSLLETLRLIARAQGGIAALARKTSVSRHALSEALAPAGNPRLRTFQSVLEAIEHGFPHGGWCPNATGAMGPLMIS
jgi:probable addiction module antidote protein